MTTFYLLLGLCFISGLILLQLINLHDTLNHRLFEISNQLDKLKDILLYHFNIDDEDDILIK